MDGPLAAPTRNRRRLYEEMAAQLARSGLSLGVRRRTPCGSVFNFYPDCRAFPKQHAVVTVFRRATALGACCLCQLLAIQELCILWAAHAASCHEEVVRAGRAAVCACVVGLPDRLWRNSSVSSLIRSWGSSCQCMTLI